MIVTNASEGHLYVVSNAGCREKDLTLMQVSPSCGILGALSSLFRVASLSRTDLEWIRGSE